MAPVQIRGTVLTLRRVDAYHALTLVAPAIATKFRPGQFITIAVGGPETSMLGRRAFAVHDVRPDHGGTVEFVFEARGPGTRWLTALRARDVLDIVGPLGRPFPIPRDPSSCLLLGVGYGSAPLFGLAARLRERGCSIDYLLGGDSADRVFGALTARRNGRSAAVATADGSFGARGPVTGLMEQIIREARTDVIYACAPMPVLREVTAIASRYDIPVQASVDVPMACGTGVCMGCVLPVTGTDGITRIVRSCVDGPVFRGDLVRWDDMDTIPFDALGAPGWCRSRTPSMPADMRARLGPGVQAELPNLVLAAAGCAGAGRELAQFVDVARVGALISKSIMAEPHTGNPAPRLAETPSGMLNSVGLQGPGVDAFLQRDLPWLLSRGARVVVSIAGQTIREYAGLAARLSDTAGVTAIEVNLSCPSAEDAGQWFALDPQRAGRVIAAVRGSARYDIPVFAKLSPDVTDIVAVASACVAAGADGLSLVNTLLGMAIDPATLRPVLAGKYGGLSGPAIRPVAVRCVWQVRAAFPDVPIIGSGGVRTGRDALELLLAGASLIAVGTEIMHDPSACSRVLRELEEELAAIGVDRAADVIGQAHGRVPRGLAWRA